MSTREDLWVVTKDTYTRVLGEPPINEKEGFAEVKRRIVDIREEVDYYDAYTDTLLFGDRKRQYLDKYYEAKRKLNNLEDVHKLFVRLRLGEYEGRSSLPSQ